MSTENYKAPIHNNLLQNNRILPPPLPSVSLPPSLSALPSGSMVSGIAGSRYLIWVIIVLFHLSSHFIYELSSWEDLLFMGTNGRLHLQASVLSVTPFFPLISQNFFSLASCGHPYLIPVAA